MRSVIFFGALRPNVRRGAIAIVLYAVLAAAGYVAAQIGQDISRPDRSRPGVSRDELSRDDKWRADLRFLADELPKRHKNLFFKITREQFNREIAKIAEAVPKLSDSEIRLALWRLTTIIGDAHTRIYYGREKIFPLAFYQFSDGVFVAATTEEGKAALGAKLVRIGRTDVERAKEIVRSIITVDNESWFKQQFPTYLTDPEVLYLLKILPSADEGEFTVKDRNGKQLVIRMRPVSAKEPIKIIRPFDVAPAKPPLYLRNAEQYYWYEYLADSKTLYLNYRRCANMPSQPFNKFAQELLQFMDENPVARLVIDLRLNGGGNSAIFDPFITAISKRSYLNQTGKIFVLIGRGTFSSAYLNALRLKQDTKAVLVGEPTGQKPNAYGEIKTMNLPYSKLLVQYSTKFFKTMEGDPSTLTPDVLVDRSSWDYVNGRDPVLERALRYKGK